MHIIDFVIFLVYMSLVFSIGVYFYNKNKTREDYYVGGRSIKPWHVGLSVVATDVGGGFSIGLGGLGYLIGLSGSWMLFTGLMGAWLSAVFILPKIKKIDKTKGMLTYPDFMRHIFNNKVALIAALISGIGYMGFTGGQIQAGATLAAGTIFANIPIDMNPMTFSILVIAFVILLYTVMGGLKAVIYTDTVQWILLLSGLAFLAVPFTLIEAGGFAGLSAALPDEFFSLTNVTLVDFTNWMVTIIPIWLIAMTLYQRIFATKDLKDAKKAWYIAGVFEWPVMAFLGVFLGMASRIFFPDVNPELGLPLLLRDVLPIAIKGVIISAYFSAIMSTADSCLIASSGNFVNDIIERYFLKNSSQKSLVRVSQIVTFIVGAVAITVAITSESVLSVILQAYSFMVAGLFVPTLMAYFSKRPNSNAAIWSMILGGSFTLFFIFAGIELPFGLKESFYGILISAAAYITVAVFSKNKSPVNTNRGF